MGRIEQLKKRDKFTSIMILCIIIFIIIGIGLLYNFYTINNIVARFEEVLSQTGNPFEGTESIIGSGILAYQENTVNYSLLALFVIPAVFMFICAIISACVMYLFRIKENQKIISIGLNIIIIGIVYIFYYPISYLAYLYIVSIALIFGTELNGLYMTLILSLIILGIISIVVLMLMRKLKNKYLKLYFSA